MNMQVLEARRDVSGSYKVDVSKGERVGRVSSEWFSRPDDERFLSIGELANVVRDRAERSRTRAVETALIHVEANRSDPERLSLILPGAEAPVAPTHWSFGQLASQVGAPAAYLRQLPAALAGINLQYGLTSHRARRRLDGVRILRGKHGWLGLRSHNRASVPNVFLHASNDGMRRGSMAVVELTSCAVSRRGRSCQSPAVEGGRSRLPAALPGPRHQPRSHSER
jgi:hypothetical protein